MSDSDLARITYSMFIKKIKDEDNCQEIARALSIHLYEKY